MAELTLGLVDYFIFHNEKRPHQALCNRIPDEVYATGIGGGASIADHFSGQESSVPETTGQRRAAAIEEMDA